MTLSPLKKLAIVFGTTIFYKAVSLQLLEEELSQLK
ncbi:hypothetical protein CGSHiR3021_08506 [Haemophilus influenzae 22.4-21]|uniref:Uncharacterized protein n=1 Tax=Haemophilus influenzae 22.4-21 TaxID=375063 RepID=A4NXP0_HAEIF|nr:hypothetical protein CGSHiR3021_08506 [Haemophilus influenzae 22.4-21]